MVIQHYCWVAREKGRATVIQIDEEDIPIFFNGSFLLITISERRQAKDSEL
jgi:hypothetical protein